MPKERVQHANQLTNATTAGGRGGKPCKHVNDDGRSPIHYSLNVFDADGRIVTADKLDRPGCVGPCSEDVFDLAGLRQRMKVGRTCGGHRCPRSLTRSG
jgi:hypothetical protein